MTTSLIITIIILSIVVIININTVVIILFCFHVRACATNSVQAVLNSAPHQATGILLPGPPPVPCSASAGLHGTKSQSLLHMLAVYILVRHPLPIADMPALKAQQCRGVESEGRPNHSTTPHLRKTSVFVCRLRQNDAAADPTGFGYTPASWTLKVFMRPKP